MCFIEERDLVKQAVESKRTVVHCGPPSLVAFMQRNDPAKSSPDSNDTNAGTTNNKTATESADEKTTNDAEGRVQPPASPHVSRSPSMRSGAIGGTLKPLSTSDEAATDAQSSSTPAPTMADLANAAESSESAEQAQP